MEYAINPSQTKSSVGQGCRRSSGRHLGAHPETKSNDSQILALQKENKVSDVHMFVTLNSRKKTYVLPLPALPDGKCERAAGWPRTRKVYWDESKHAAPLPSPC